MTTTNFIKYPIIILIVLSVFNSCSKDEIPNEEELITSLYFNLVDSTGMDTLVMSFVDTDGDGGLPPVIKSADLKSNHKYYGAIILLNESRSPSINITEEVSEESENHQFFYTSSGSAPLVFNYLDFDPDSYPLGMQVELITGAPGTGVLDITLRHQPDKKAAGVKEGNKTNAGGETDIEVQFNFLVK